MLGYAVIDDRTNGDGVMEHGIVRDEMCGVGICVREQICKGESCDQDSNWSAAQSFLTQQQLQKQSNTF